MALTYVVNHSTLKTNLVSWWSLNEESDGTGAVTRYDAHTVNGNDLDDINTTASAAGLHNRGADFESSNSERVRITDANHTGLDIAGSWSISCWIKFESLPTAGNGMGIVTKSNVTTSDSYFISIYNSAGTQYIYTQARKNTSQQVGNFHAFSFSTGTWYHWVTTFDASAGTIKTYIDNTLEETVTDSNITSIQNSSLDFSIGSHSTTRYFDGLIQDVGVWDKVLTTDEISDLYNSGEGMTYGVNYDTGTGQFNNSLARPASMTWSHTCTGTDRVLLVAVESSVSGAVTGVDYNSTAMTLIDSYSTGPSVFNETLLYALANPSSGSNTVSVNTTGSGNIYCYAKASSYVGVDQTTPTPHDNKNTGTSTTLTLSIDTSGAPSTDNCWIACGAFTDGNYSQTAGAGTTRRTALASIDNWVSFFDNNIAISPAASDDLVVNIGTSSLINSVGASLAPVSEAAGATFTPKVMWFS